MLKRFSAIAACSLLLRVAPLAAQDPATVEALAPLLMMEDRRAFDAAVLAPRLTNPDALIRRTAVMTIGRIGDRRGVALLLPLLADPDGSVVTTTFFALGLLRDSSTVGAIMARLRSPDSLSADAVGEAATALARIGGATAARYLGSVLSGASDLSSARQSAFIPNALLDAWKLGALMPAPAMLHFTTDTSVELRWRSLYSLGRQRVAAAGSAILRALRDRIPLVREVAAKSLTRAFADSAALPAQNVKAELVRALDDELPGVRINALNALATFADSTTTQKVAALLGDGDPNVRVAAVTALGELKGGGAARALDAMMDRKDASWAMKRAGIAAIARVDTVAFARRAPLWLASPDFRDRIAALQVWGSLAPAEPVVFRAALGDRDARVQAAALDGWRASRGQRSDTALATIARARLMATDAGVRASAATTLRRYVTQQDLDPLLAAWRMSQADLESEARLAVLGTLRALSQAQPQIVTTLDDANHRAFLERPADPLVVAQANRTWPDVASRWGDKWPIDTRIGLEDYRTLVRTYLLSDSDPHVTIEVEGRGTIEIQLLGHEAPLTVANFLRLVDRHYFDNNRWHRVVPNFVVQDGDRTGTGNGGPGWSIRDEINRERYALPMLGMALSGADTGGSQWFINLSAQPHLDGQYTIFGKVTGGYVGLARIAQGDVIRSIHR